MRCQVAGARPTLCGDVRTAKSVLRRRPDLLDRLPSREVVTQMLMVENQREHTATIKDAPKTYPHSEPAKKINIINIDCRGLEFVEYKPDVSQRDLTLLPALLC